MDEITMMGILQEIVNYPSFDIEDDNEKNIILESILSKFEKFYKCNRHSYSEIAEYMDELSPDQRDSLEKNISELVLISDENNLPIRDNLLKLHDHIKLEVIRIARVAKMDFVAKNAVEKVDNINHNLDELVSKAEKITSETKDVDEKVKNMHSETITILGIFAGLVIGFATSFQLLGTTFSKLGEVPIYRELAFIFVIGLILFNCLFLLLFSVARISGRSLATNCKRKDCSSCHENDCSKRSVRRFIKKYPYVFWFNLIALIGFMTCIIFEVFCKFLK